MGDDHQRQVYQLNQLPENQVRPRLIHRRASPPCVARARRSAASLVVPTGFSERASSRTNGTPPRAACVAGETFFRTRTTSWRDPATTTRYESSDLRGKRETDTAPSPRASVVFFVSSSPDDPFDPRNEITKRNHVALVVVRRAPIAPRPIRIGAPSSTASFSA